MAYATVQDVQARLSYTMTQAQQELCGVLLDDAAVMIDAVASTAAADAKKVVSCRMVQRAMGDLDGSGQVPMGATQGSMSGLGYSQSWTISSGATGELYIGKLEKKLLGCGDAIGSYSPTEALVPTEGTL